ncbi:fructosamine kinase family protein [Georgenia thermotolerans]|uniref:Phosphotransferase n=1 Tax=Georgenia thermotolerans TaxID=527326 RepID=A0A7J5UK79_9MICO|nr:fructosamine kinase family protein [Georgenia thermotolerans]KAE8762767.1 phosphotransferase [Georgenia thermotolerans]
MRAFRKDDHGLPGATGFEAAGLRWLGAAAGDGGAPVADVVAQGQGWIETRRIDEGRPDLVAAEELGRSLARTHAAGGSHLGCPPPGWQGDGFMGRAPLPLRAEPGPSSWGAFYATDRLLPYLPTAVGNGSIDADGERVVRRCAERLAAGDHDAPQPALVTGAAARLHGDLWGGNVLWAARAGGVTATLIDPAAHGGHAESDLAQLAVFDAPHRERIVAAYDEVSPLAPGWRERVGLHQLHMLIVHAALFGGAYGRQTVATAARYA